MSKDRYRVVYASDQEFMVVDFHDTDKVTTKTPAPRDMPHVIGRCGSAETAQRIAVLLSIDDQVCRANKESDGPKIR